MTFVKNLYIMEMANWIHRFFTFKKSRPKAGIKEIPNYFVLPFFYFSLYDK